MRNAAIAYMCQHLVGLCMTYQLKDQGEMASFEACSATVLKVKNEHFLLTAGHVLEQIERSVRSDAALAHSCCHG